MNEVIAEGKTIDDAVEQAIVQLERTRKQVEVVVLTQPKAGFLGLFQRKAKVKVFAKALPDEVALQFLTQCLQSMEVDAEIELLPNKQQKIKTIQFSSEHHMGLLIGSKGRTIESLQFLVNQVVTKKCGYSHRYLLDGGGYRAHRKEKVLQITERCMQEVQKNNKAVYLDPMPSLERKIVHNRVQKDADLTTESKGIDPHRHVVIKKRESV